MSGRGKYDGISTKSILDGSYFDVDDEEDEEIYDEEQKQYLYDENTKKKEEKIDLLELQKEKYYEKPKRIAKKKVVKKLNMDESPTMKKIELIQEMFEKESQREVAESVNFEFSIEEHFYLNYERLKYTSFSIEKNPRFEERRKEIQDERRQKRDYTRVEDKDVKEMQKPVPKTIERKLQTLPCKRSFFASAVSGNMIWIHGGYDGKNILSDVLSFDVTTNEWRKHNQSVTEGPRPIQRHKMIVSPDHKELILLAASKKGNFLTPFRLKGIQKDEWEGLRWSNQNEQNLSGEKILPRSDYSLTSFGSTAILYGGRITSSALDDLYILDLTRSTNIHIEKVTPDKNATWPCERYGHAAEAYYGSLLIFGGQRKNQQGFLNDLYLFDLSTQKWKEIIYDGIRMVPSSFHSSGIAGSHLVLYGGLSENSILECGYKFDLINKKWSIIKPMGPTQQELSQYELQIPLYGASSSIVNNKMVIIGGTIKDRVLNHMLAINEIYDQGKPFLLSDHLIKNQKEKNLCDMEFEVIDENNESKIIHAHKAVIGVRSPSLLDFTKITNCNFDVFSAYIEYLYCGKVKLKGKNNISFLPEFSEFLGDHHTEVLKKICYQDAFIDICQEIMDDMENDFEELIDSTQYSDITLTVEDEDISIPAHKLILYRSPYFRSMFSSGMLESQTNNIDFQNMDKSAVLEVMNFLYTDRIQVTSDNCVGVLVYSLMFGVSEISEYCRSIVEQHLNIQNVVEILEIADIYNDGSLRRICLNFIKTNYEDVKLDKDFENLDINLKQLSYELHQKEQKKERKKLMFQFKKKK